MRFGTSVSAAAVAAALLMSAPAHAVSLGTFVPGSKGTVTHYGGFEDVTWNFDWAAFGTAAPAVHLTYKAEVVSSGNLDFGGVTTNGFEAALLNAGWTPTAEGWVLRHSIYGAALLSNFDSGQSGFAIGVGDVGDVVWGRHIISYEVSPVPIPAAGLLLASALGVAALMRRRKA